MTGVPLQQLGAVQRERQPGTEEDDIDGEFASSAEAEAAEAANGEDYDTDLPEDVLERVRLANRVPENLERTMVGAPMDYEVPERFREFQEQDGGVITTGHASNNNPAISAQTTSRREGPNPSHFGSPPPTRPQLERS